MVSENSKEVRLIRWASLLKGADEATHNAVKALQIHAVYGNLSHRRAYPGRELASHVLGYVNKEENSGNWYREIF